MDKSEAAASKKEIQEKLNKQYIDTKINPIMEPLAMQFFSAEQPPNDVVSNQIWLGFPAWFGKFL